MPKVQNVIVETFHEQSPFDRVMAIWVRWMRLDDRPYSDGDGNPQDTKEFMLAGEALDVMVDSLPRHQWWAIHKSRGLVTVWNFPSVNIEDALRQAEENLTPKIKNHVATRRFFN